MAKSAAAASPGDESFGARVKAWPQRVKGFYRDVRGEMRKVTTPSGKEVRSMTGVVIITVALFGVYFLVVDMVLGFGIDGLIRYFTNR